MIINHHHHYHLGHHTFPTGLSFLFGPLSLWFLFFQCLDLSAPFPMLLTPTQNSSHLNAWDSQIPLSGPYPPRMCLEAHLSQPKKVLLDKCATAQK